VAQQSVTEFVATTLMKLVTPKAAAKHELLLIKPTSAYYDAEFFSTHNKF